MVYLLKTNVMSKVIKKNPVMVPEPEKNNIDLLLDLIKKYPNDQDLGREVRKLILHVKDLDNIYRC